MCDFLDGLAVFVCVARFHLRDNDASFPVYCGGFEEHAVAIVAQQKHSVVEQLVRDFRHVEFIDGFGEARMGVCIGPESHSEPLEIFDHTSRGEVGCTIECHVLDEVREPPFGLGFVGGAAPDKQPH